MPFILIMSIEVGYLFGYVDNLIFTETNPSLFEDFKKTMTREFEMTYIGLMSYYLGTIEDCIFVSYVGYASHKKKST